jgi:hypothetical protein
MDNKESLSVNNKKTLPCISIDEPLKHFHKIIRDKEQYEDDVIGDYIYFILYSKCCEQSVIIEWIRNNLSDNIDFIVEELMKYIKRTGENHGRLRFEIFDICCSLNLYKTKDIYMSQKEQHHDIFVYTKILELHELREELCKYKNKYESVRSNMEYMSNGLLYFEANEDYQRYMNRIQ